MKPPKNLPDDVSQIHPWIASLLNKDKVAVASAIKARFHEDPPTDFNSLADYMGEVTPLQIVFSDDGVGYVVCGRLDSRGYISMSGDVMVIPQPLSAPELAARLRYFDDSFRPTFRKFLEKYAGCGEEMDPVAGQFVYRDELSAHELAYDKPEKLGFWKDARVLYWASSGDLVLIHRTGATAWHVMETNAVVPLFDTFPQFVSHYAKFRRTSNVFDSWSSRDLLQAGH